MRHASAPPLYIPLHLGSLVYIIYMSRNLFRPGFGSYPHVLVGRDDLLDEFEDAFIDGTGPSGQTVLLSGQRGMGKTVLLDAYRASAEDAGWVVITESSSTGLLDRLTRDQLPRLLQQFSEKDALKATGREGQALGFGFAMQWEDRYPAESTLRSQIAELTSVLREKGVGLVITVDEIQSADIEELRKLGEIIQFARRENRLLAFAAAGLSTPVEELLDHPGATFLQRADHHEIGPVSRAAVRSGIAQTVADAGAVIEVEALDAAADAAAGYPFMIQLVGFHAMKQARGTSVIGMDEVREGVAAARRRLGRLVLDSALRPLSDVDRTYLLAMSQDEGSSSTADVARRMGVDANYANQYRTRLIRDGIIEPGGYGRVRFTIPYMSEHLRSHAASDALDGLST